MNKILKFIVGMILTASIFLLATACGSSLDAPVPVLDNDELVLSWVAVPNARSYRIEIGEAGGERKENIVQRTSYDLSSLEEGDYEIRVRSVGGAGNDVFSPWSDTVAFHKDRESGLLYTATNGNTEYEVRSAGSAGGDVVIERTYRGKPVTGIGDTAFRGSTKVTSVVIPDSVKYIGKSAFYNCSNLVSVTIPESVTSIGRAAFQQCSNLKEIRIPESVTAIEPFTFAYCRALASVEMGQNTLSIGESAFTNCSSLTELTLPDSVETIEKSAFRQLASLTKVTFGSGIRSIGQMAFDYCALLRELVFKELSGELTLDTYAFAECPQLNNVELPQGLTAISQYCFVQDTALDNIKIPSSVTSIALQAFYGSKLYIDQMQSGDNLVYADHWIVDATEDFKKTVEIMDETSFREGTVGIGDAAFRYIWSYEEETVDEDGNPVFDEEGNPVMHTVQEFVSCEKLRRIRFPASLKYIGSAAFYHAPSLQRIIAEYNDSLVSIGSYAFALCDTLNNVRLASGLREIGTRAFFRCTRLNYNQNNPELLIPDTVTRVGENAYFDTELWKDESTLEDGVVYAGNWVVGYHIDPVTEGEETSHPLIELKPETVGICDYAFYADTALQNISGLNNITRIGKGAFAYCTSLTNVNLNRNLRVIEDYTFYLCKSIYSVTFPTMLQSIGRDAFYRCDQLRELDLHGTRVTSIGDSAFRQAGLTSIDLGDTVETIGKYAFYNNWFLEEVVIPDSVVSVGERAFGDCWALQSVSLGTGLKEIEDYTFSYCEWLRDLTIPSNIERIGDYAFYGCKRLTSLTIGEGVQTIGDYAFYGNERLAQAQIPASVKSIGVFAFKGCTNLSTVLFKGKPDMIDENAFYGCPRLTIYGTGDGVGDWSAYWNSSQRPAVWDVVLSEDGTYVESVTVDNVTYPHARFGYAGPGREGYVFVGWSTKQGATEAEYTAAQLETLPAGTTVYSVWEVAPPVDDQEAWEDEYADWLLDMLMKMFGQATGNQPQQPSSGEGGGDPANT